MKETTLRIRAAAFLRGINSIGELANAIGLDRSTLSAKLNGDRPWKLSDMQALVRVLKVNITELFDGLEVKA